MALKIHDFTNVILRQSSNDTVTVSRNKQTKYSMLIDSTEVESCKKNKSIQTEEFIL